MPQEIEPGHIGTLTSGQADEVGRKTQDGKVLGRPLFVGEFEESRLDFRERKSAADLRSGRTDDGGRLHPRDARPGGHGQENEKGRRSRA